MQIHPKQQGMALIMLVFIVGLATVGYLLYALNPVTVKIEREKKTAAALAEAKAALIGWSLRNNIPGKLPCPEDTLAIGTLNEGNEGSCTNANPIIGRLPWRTLGLGDLRDGYGERLWYKLSTDFRSGMINSDTSAQLNVDGTAGGAVAIIFSPGPAINGQTRPAPTIATPPDKIQYLDLSNNDGDESFITSGPPDSFNDHLMIISRDDLFNVVEKRVAAEALICLTGYAEIPATGLPGSGGGGKYPWPAQLDVVSLPTYADTSGQLFGRLPDTPFDNTHTDNSSMGTSWPGLPCKIISNSGWWLNWKELVFFAIDDEYKPTGTAAPCGTCLTVNPPSTSSDKKVVVMVAGKGLPGQTRSTNNPAHKGNVTNYLEAPNNGGVSFAQQRATSLFNDVVVYH